MIDRSWSPYVPAAQRRAQAEREKAKAKKAGREMSPVEISGRTFARSFWGKAWCENLEAYSDYANRLPRGRSYVRNGSVVDLSIEPGRVRASVMGSSLYMIEIAILSLPGERWAALAKECTGSIASLVELLQGKFSKAVMERLCQPKTGLFPSPKEIRLSCSCPDWASMCKHVAAALYGIGARLDERPDLLFVLRQVDAGDLVTRAAEFSPKTDKRPAGAQVLPADHLEDLFGLEMAAVEPPALPGKAENRPASTAGISEGGPKAPEKKKEVSPKNGRKGMASRKTEPELDGKAEAASAVGKKTVFREARPKRSVKKTSSPAGEREAEGGPAAEKKAPDSKGSLPAARRKASAYKSPKKV